MHAVCFGSSAEEIAAVNRSSRFSEVLIIGDHPILRMGARNSVLALSHVCNLNRTPFVIADVDRGALCSAMPDIGMKVQLPEWV